MGGSVRGHRRVADGDEAGSALWGGAVRWSLWLGDSTNVLFDKQPTLTNQSWFSWIVLSPLNITNHQPTGLVGWYSTIMVWFLSASLNAATASFSSSSVLFCWSRWSGLGQPSWCEWQEDEPNPEGLAGGVAADFWLQHSVECCNLMTCSTINVCKLYRDSVQACSVWCKCKV